MSSISSFLYGQIIQSVPSPTNSFAGQTIIITGANGGLGYDTAAHLIRLGVSHLILGCRSLQRGEEAKEKLLHDHDASTKIDVWEVDLSSYKSVLAFASRCTHNLQRIDGLLNNAGVIMPDFTLAENTEATITINVISTFLLSILLLPKLRASAMKYNVTPHLVIVGSMIHLFAEPDQLTIPVRGKIFESLNDAKTARMNPQRYYLSKLMTMLLIRELAQRANFKDSTAESEKSLVIISGPNPGWCFTDLHRNAPLGAAPQMMFKLIGRSSEAGARTLVHALAAGDETNGQYMSECRVKPPSPFVRSAQGARIQSELWEELMGRLEDIQPGISRNV